MRIIIFLVFLFFCVVARGQSTQTTIYFIPGQGADERLFSKLEINSDYDIQHVQYVVPEKNTSLQEYARLLSEQIDTTKQFVLIGTSLGGMLSVEMNEFLTPLKTIIISSAKSKKELPFRYRFQKVIPLYRLFSSRAIKRGATIMQPIVEPDRNNEKEIFVTMLAEKDKYFMKRSVQMIIQWDRTNYPVNIVHVHGETDKTIPIRNVKYDYLIKEGSHMMTLTRPIEISEIINQELGKVESGMN